MPELAEVETVRRQLQKKLVGKKIKEVTVDNDDRWLFAYVSPATVKKTLEKRKITGTGRKGKYFWLELDKKPWPIFHLGMSGNISVQLKGKTKNHERAWGGVNLWSGKDDQRRLWFSRLLLEMTDGTETAFIDPRRFGRMWLADDPWENSRIKKLGFDPLIDFPKAAVLATKLAKRKKAIKSVLLDQGLFAGIGNWLADEILFQAKINPHTLASKLKPAQIKILHAKTLEVVKKAVKVEADYERFPKTWLFHERWGKSKGANTSRGKIIHEEIGGRTTAWVPTWQK